MEYLKQLMGIQVSYQDELPKAMPIYINERYRLREVLCDGHPVLFVYPKRELESVSAVKKHFVRMEEIVGHPAVLILDRLTYREKEYLLRDHVPFIVEGKQIYLPFMAVYIQERSDAESSKTKELLPSSQVLLLHFIYGNCKGLLTSDAAVELGFTATSMSRASRQLEELGLVHAEKRGVQKMISSPRKPTELFELAKPYLCNPVKRKIYVPKNEIKTPLLLSGDSALSEYSMINPPEVKCMASDSVALWEEFSSDKLQNTKEQYEIELWRYDPKRLSDGDCVDKLSLVLSLNETGDERVEEAVEELLESVWEDIDGSRNRKF